MNDKVENIENKIKGLESLKEKWNEKYSELLDHVKSYVGCNDAEYVEEFQRKLNTISDELREIGKEYHHEVEIVADGIITDYKDNPIIQNLVEGVKSDVDDNWNVYHGNREARLRDLAEVIAIFDKMQ